MDITLYTIVCHISNAIIMYNAMQGAIMISLIQLYIARNIDRRVSLTNGKGIFLRIQTDGITVLTKYQLT